MDQLRTVPPGSEWQHTGANVAAGIILFIALGLGAFYGLRHLRLLTIQRTVGNYRQCWQNLDTLYAAIEAYRLAQGHPPATLDELIQKGYLAAMPVNPYAGRPMKALQAADGSSAAPGQTHLYKLASGYGDYHYFPAHWELHWNGPGNKRRVEFVDGAYYLLTQVKNMNARGLDGAPSLPASGFRCAGYGANLMRRPPEPKPASFGFRPPPDEVHVETPDELAEKWLTALVDQGRVQKD